MNIDEVVWYFGIFFFYIIPWLLMILAFGWLRDWVLDVYVRWKRKTTKTLNEGETNRWVLILALMKFIMFVVLLMPVIAVIEYLLDDSNTDPASTIFNETMWYVFLVITIWYMLAIIVFGIQKANATDMEQWEIQQEQEKK